jgi:hypothetical protein
MSQFDTPFAQAVAALGETPESVTEALRAKGIKGYRRMAGSCPIANYLKACGFPKVSVATDAKRYMADSEDSDESVSFPKGVRDWISSFDDGKYPEFYVE